MIPEGYQAQRAAEYYSRPQYTVYRHSGTRNGRWRLIRGTPNESLAWASFCEVSRTMRRGAVRMMTPGGVMRAEYVLTMPPESPEACD
jgi:hypothetical protein